jgi:hypothetical protein
MLKGDPSMIAKKDHPKPKSQIDQPSVVYGDSRNVQGNPALIHGIDVAEPKNQKA